MDEQEKVNVAQGTSPADLKNGRTYANRYAIIVHFEGNKIDQFREYSETAHINAAFDIVL